MYRSWFQKTLLKDEQGLLFLPLESAALELSALEDFLDGKSDSIKAAIRITAQCSTEDREQEEKDATDPHRVWLFERLWATFLSAAREIPDIQDRLVQLVAAIKSLPNLHEDTNPLSRIGWTWADLPYLQEFMRDEWGYHEPPPNDPDLVKKRREWQNVNAFTARLTTARCGDLSWFGMLALGDALECDYLNPVDWRKLDGLVPAAAQWILHAGQFIYENLFEIESSATRGAPFQGCDLYGMRHGESIESWSLWKDRFEWVSKNLDLELETRQIAGEAFESMGRAEGR